MCEPGTVISVKPILPRFPKMASVRKKLPVLFGDGAKSVMLWEVELGREERKVAVWLEKYGQRAQMLRLVARMPGVCGRLSRDGLV